MRAVGYCPVLGAEFNIDLEFAGEEIAYTPCPHCEGAFALRPGVGLEHVPCVTVRCESTQRLENVYRDDGVRYGCTHCGGIFTVRHGEITHTAPDNIESAPLLNYHFSFLEDGHDGHRHRSILLVHGYLNREGERLSKDYSHWLKTCRASGWKGSVYALRWDSGCFGDVLHQLLAKVAIKIIIPSPVTLGPVLVGCCKDIIMHWKNACGNADSMGEILGRLIISAAPVWANKDLTIIAHSLGTRVVYRALSVMAGAGGDLRANNIYLFGGALPVSSNWDIVSNAVTGNIFNGYSKNDLVLRFLYKTAEFKKPIGLDRVVHSKVINVDYTNIIKGHCAYETDLSSVGFTV